MRYDIKIYKSGRTGFLPALFLFVCLLTVQSSFFAQTIIMPVSGHRDTTMSYAEVYDDGGPSSPHSSSCNASYTFHTTTPTGHYRVEVYSYLTHPSGNATLKVKNGSSTGSQICSFPAGSGGVFYSSSGTVTITFQSDDDNPDPGFKVILCEYNNRVPTNLSTDFIDSNTHYVRWNHVPNVTWTVEYAVVCEDVNFETFFSDPANYTTLYLDTSYFEVPDVPVGCFLVYRIYTESTTPCTRITTGFTYAYSEPFQCPCIEITSINVEQLTDSIRISWTSDSLPSVWHVSCYQLGFDTTLPGTCTELTIPYDYPCFGPAMQIRSDCNYPCATFWVSLPNGGCQTMVHSIRRNAVTSSSISLLWNAVDDPTARYLLYFGLDGSPQQDDVLLDTLAYDDTSYTVEGLLPHTTYRFTIVVLCADGRLSCYKISISTSTTIDNCIDYFNRFNPNVHFASGTYQNPNQSQSYVSGRHTAIADTSMRDINTGNQLRCVPQGEETSFRLGDDDIGAKGESVTFDYLVDSLDKDMLVLRYAIIMQNPNHTSENQPHFTMEILDNTGHVIDTTCCYADFYAAGELGWNTVAGSNVIWKDWTTVGINIAPYHGQNIKIRFTTKDCADGGHFGYAYFTIHCDSKRIALVNMCENVDSVRLRAPEGFEYNWFHGNDTTVISTENEILVPADTTEYYCYASFIGKPECNFVVRSFAVLPVPRAAFSYQIDTCNKTISLVDNSYVDIDSAYRQYVRQTIDSIYWKVDGVTFFGDSIRIDISSNRTYEVQLYCMLSGSLCLDSTSKLFDVDFYHNAAIEGPTEACYGSQVTLSARLEPFDDCSSQWNDGSVDTTVVFTAITDTVLSLMSQYLSCLDTTFHSVKVNPVFSDTVYFESCPGFAQQLDFEETETGTYTHQTYSSHGCDSSMTLCLTVFPAYDDTLAVVTCDEPYYELGFEADSSGVYSHANATTNGCDSLTTIVFNRKIPFADTVVTEIFYGSVYSDANFTEDRTGVYHNDFVDVDGCDSTYTLDLNVVRIIFPNVVTPNGDGYNDFLGITDILETNIVYVSKIWVYDRWGRRIYYCDNIRSESDFWHPAKTKTPDGTYYYRFVADTSKGLLEHKGVVEVVGSVEK